MKLSEIAWTLKVSKRELADILGVHEQSIYNWESGGNLPNGNVLKKLDEIGFDVFSDTPKLRKGVTMELARKKAEAMRNMPSDNKVC